MDYELCTVVFSVWLIAMFMWTYEEWTVKCQNLISQLHND